MSKAPRAKALRDVGLAALCAGIRAIRVTAESVGSAATALAEATARALGEVDEALKAKADASHKHKKADISDFPSSMTPTGHAGSHSSGGSDPITPANIGAAASGHTHTAASVGALPSSGGTVSGDVTITGNLRLKGSGNYGNMINLGDGDYIHFYEPTDDYLEIKAKKINFLISGGAGGFTLNDTQLTALTASVTIPASGWSSDSTATYPKYYDIAVTGVTDKDRASVDIAPAGMAAAVACGLCPVTETLADKIRIRAASVPSSSIAAKYWVEKGV